MDEVKRDLEHGVSREVERYDGLSVGVKENRYSRQTFPCGVNILQRVRSQFSLLKT